MTTADYVREREALDELVRSDGWKVFVGKVRLEYQGQGYFQMMQQALQGGNKEARILNETAKGILNLLNWPYQRIKELEAVKG